MSIKVQPFVIDAAVLDLIGNEFKFDHAKGIAEWLKNSADAYRREDVSDSEQLMIVRLATTQGGRLSRIECIDFVGMTKVHIEDAFRRFFDPQAAKKFASRQEQIKTLGGHGNGGKFYMRQMFKTSQAICYRNGRVNVFAFNERKQYGYETGYEDRKMGLAAALELADLSTIILPKKIKSALEMGEIGFTVLRGNHPVRVATTPNLKNLIDRLVIHPQARRLIEKKQVCLTIDDQKEPLQLTVPRIHPKEGFEQPQTTPIPKSLVQDGENISFTSEKFPSSGSLVLKTSNEPLRGAARAPLNVIDFIGEVGVVASYPVSKLGTLRSSGMAEFIYGECKCPILEDPDSYCVRNDRQSLIEENGKTQAILEWVRNEVETFAHTMEEKAAAERRKHDLRNTSQFNRLLNTWKNRFLQKLFLEAASGRGPSGISGLNPSAGGGGGGGKQTSSSKTAVRNKSGEQGGDQRKRNPRFPTVLISGQDPDPLAMDSSTSFDCDPRHPAIYQRPQDVTAGVYWINTSRPLAEKILQRNSADSPRWREYVFQRYVDIILREAIYLLGKEEPTLTPDDISRKVDDVTTKIHDQAAQDLDRFLFDEKFSA
jgi:hypothetical protein